MTDITVYRANGADETIHLPSDQACHIEQGDNVMFPCVAQDIANVERRGVDLNLYFKDNTQWCLSGFFHAERPNIESVLTFDDALYTAAELDESFTELDTNELTFDDVDKHIAKADARVLSANNKKAQQIPGAAVENSLYAYHFSLADDTPDDAKIIVKANGETMPSWLSLTELGNKHYMLSGIPSEKDIGQLDIEIFIEV